MNRYAELDFVVQKLGSSPSICERCEAKLSSYADKCVADLSECCPGFLAIENAKAEFHRKRNSQEPKPEKG